MNCPNCGAPPLHPPSAQCHVCGASTAEAGTAPWTGKVTTLPPAEAMGVLAREITARGAHVVTHSETMMTGTVTVPKQPNMLAAIVLFLLCIVPMVIYMIVQSRPDVYGWSIQVAPEGPGSRVTYSGQGQAGAMIFQAVSALP